jgi:hypothetical protein
LLLEVCRKLCDLYLTEHAPVAADTIYSESVPMRVAKDSFIVLRGGINVFYGSAHRTRNHDRRVPGGILISVNSPGLLAHSLVTRGLAPDLDTALQRVRALAWASIGNGGISRNAADRQSCSWHNIDPGRTHGQCPMKHRPQHVPELFDTERYSAQYHTDVLLPSSVMLDDRVDLRRDAAETWQRLDFAYLSALEMREEHENFGFVRGPHLRAAGSRRHRWRPTAPSVQAREAR